MYCTIHSLGIAPISSSDLTIHSFHLVWISLPCRVVCHMSPPQLMQDFLRSISTEKLRIYLGHDGLKNQLAANEKMHAPVGSVALAIAPSVRTVQNLTSRLFTLDPLLNCLCGYSDLVMPLIINAFLIIELPHRNFPAYAKAVCLR
ncbi:uncharacterized protein BDR25DRAFT_348646 [Lindgomyces ingoldianus]|uniref:Uncharacterized protein n=1 Tax=Lindgomyces ingoldianus TaxID=673940 RepID=A0ACB6RGL6_9PLEO|nr:uncharacterized protein BDR25DRAFT_348646 [Lindgomyces ingoldianus]KAF2478389.1 hypothetical protein BDR25DRAFT_348646 [Lindgomyces ingoldianus]